MFWSDALLKIKYAFFGIILLFLSFLFSFLKLFPKREIYLFTPFKLKKFIGNVKYLYLYLSEIGENAVLLSNNKNLVEELTNNGYKAVYLFSFEAIKYILISKFIIRDFVNIQYSFIYNACKYDIQLWHGVGIKRIEYDIKNSATNIIRKLSPFSYEPSLLFATSPFYARYFSKAFKIERSKVLNVGNYPRNVVLFKKIKGEEISACLLKKKKNEIWVLFAPTFRDYPFNYSSLVSEVVDSVEKYSKKVNKKVTLLIKLHPRIDIKDIKVHSKLINVKLLKCDDIYPLLRYVDILITDYSSILFDFILLGRKVIQYIPDYNSYSSTGRILLDPKMLGVPYAETADELFNKMLRAKISDIDTKFFFSEKDPNRALVNIYTILKSLH